MASSPVSAPTPVPDTDAPVKGTIAHQQHQRAKAVSSEVSTAKSAKGGAKSPAQRSGRGAAKEARVPKRIDAIYQYSDEEESEVVEEGFAAAGRSSVPIIVVPLQSTSSSSATTATAPAVVPPIPATTTTTSTTTTMRGKSATTATTAPSTTTTTTTKSTAPPRKPSNPRPESHVGMSDAAPDVMHLSVVPSPMLRASRDDFDLDDAAIESITSDTFEKFFESNKGRESTTIGDLGGIAATAGLTLPVNVEAMLMDVADSVTRGAAGVGASHVVGDVGGDHMMIEGGESGVGGVGGARKRRRSVRTESGGKVVVLGGSDEGATAATVVPPPPKKRGTGGKASKKKLSEEFLDDDEQDEIVAEGDTVAVQPPASRPVQVPVPVPQVSETTTATPMDEDEGQVEDAVAASPPKKLPKKAGVRLGMRGPVTKSAAKAPAPAKKGAVAESTVETAAQEPVGPPAAAVVGRSRAPASKATAGSGSTSGTATLALEKILGFDVPASRTSATGEPTGGVHDDGTKAPPAKDAFKDAFEEVSSAADAVMSLSNGRARSGSTSVTRRTAAAAAVASAAPGDAEASGSSSTAAASGSVLATAPGTGTDRPWYWKLPYGEKVKLYSEMEKTWYAARAVYYVKYTNSPKTFLIVHYEGYNKKWDVHVDLSLSTQEIELQMLPQDPDTKKQLKPMPDVYRFAEQDVWDLGNKNSYRLGVLRKTQMDELKAGLVVNMDRACPKGVNP
ncbi:hypothetical protein HDU76_013651 [Blyttiomyces sp. JEL0837]|nr:hypothetical protein HDU76_013651 [Blyttiomyces sp. JEL0837]